ncbi:MAG: hypothetical protein LBT16_06815 [Treponema sp.]|jgi:ABC-type phosphate/phosphonate transport system substrate-binding protein|nr:hypothetical protein [Treponema sp.]
MKKRLLFSAMPVSLLIFGLTVIGCASTKDAYRPLTPEEQSQFTVLGSVQVAFEISHVSSNKETNLQKAYALLLQEVSKKYEGNIDVRDITLTYIDNGIELLDAEYMAVGKVIIPVVK